MRYLLPASVIALALSACAGFKPAAPPRGPPSAALPALPIRPEELPTPRPWEGRMIQALPPPLPGGYPVCTPARTDQCLQRRALGTWIGEPSGISYGRHWEPAPSRQESANDIAAEDSAGSAAEACLPGDLDCNRAAPGRGAFAKAPEMWVDMPAELVFAAAPSDAVVRIELGRRRQAEEAEDIAIGRCMRVTLEEHPAFDILTRNGETRILSRDRDRASWKWMIRPKDSGAYDLRARVEVLRMAGEDCTDRSWDNYKSEVHVQVEISFWKSFLRALREAKTVGELFGALFQSWKTALVSLGALIVAIGTVAAAWRGLKGKKG